MCSYLVGLKVEYVVKAPINIHTLGMWAVKSSARKRGNSFMSLCYSLKEKVLKSYELAYMGLNKRKMNVLQASQKGTDQPAHPRSLISAFVIHYLERIVANLAPCII